MIKCKIDGRAVVLTYEGTRWGSCVVFHEPGHARAHTFSRYPVKGDKFRCNGHDYDFSDAFAVAQDTQLEQSEGVES